MGLIQMSKISTKYLRILILNLIISIILGLILTGDLSNTFLSETNQLIKIFIFFHVLSNALLLYFIYKDEKEIIKPIALMNAIVSTGPILYFSVSLFLIGLGGLFFAYLQGLLFIIFSISMLIIHLKLYITLLRALLS